MPSPFDFLDHPFAITRETRTLPTVSQTTGVMTAPVVTTVAIKGHISYEQQRLSEEQGMERGLGGSGSPLTRDGYVYLHTAAVMNVGHIVLVTNSATPDDITRYAIESILNRHPTIAKTMNMGAAPRVTYTMKISEGRTSSP